MRLEYVPRRKWRYPLALEKGYFKLLKQFVDSIFSAYKKHEDYINATVNNAKIKVDSDDPVDDIVNAIQSDILSREKIAPKVSNTFDIVAGFNKKEFDDIMSSMRVNALTNESWYQQYKQQWIAENMGLIKSIESETMRRIESEMREAIALTVEDGIRTKYLQNRIQELSGVTMNRAKLIARDQVGKLNGRITQYRQQSCGIKKYVWSTVKDERVRALHADRDGKVFEWSKPPSDGHPGMPIRCRCVAQPVINFQDMSEHGFAVPRANKIAVQIAMKRWGFNTGSLYKNVVGAVLITPQAIEPIKPVKGKKLTKAQQKQAIIDKYAERFAKRNIIIEHKFTGWDLRSIEVTLRQWDILLDKFPSVRFGTAEKPLIITVEKARYTMASVAVSGKTLASMRLYINNRYFKKLSRRLKVPKKNPGDSIYTTKLNEQRYTMAHEFGHAVHNELVLRKLDVNLIRYGLSEMRKALITEFTKEIKAKAVEFNNGNPIDEFMSKYGGENSREWFAEAFCHAMLTKPSELTPIGKAMLWFLDKEGLL